jgi:hypothetical protein
MAFVASVQDDFYQKWTDALRKAGYQSLIEYSNWQAGRMHSHYYNLHSDAKAGIIDRHNYFGGGCWWSSRTNRFPARRRWNYRTCGPPRRSTR